MTTRTQRRSLSRKQIFLHANRFIYRVTTGAGGGVQAGPERKDAMKTTAIAVALALVVATLGALAQDAGGPPPPGGPPGGGPGRGRAGFHLLPPRAVEQLNLTADQQKQLTDLETEVKAKLEKILTPEQQQQLKQMRPPPPPRGGRGAGGPGAGAPGPDDQGERPPEPPPPPPAE